MFPMPRLGRRALVMLPAALPVLAAPRFLSAQPAQPSQSVLPPGSIGGVVGEIDRERNPFPPLVSRSMEPELLRQAAPFDPGPSFPGKLRAWLDHADGAYTLGETAQIGIESSAPCFIQILGARANGSPVWLYPPDSLIGEGLPSEGVPLQQDTPLLVPQPAMHNYVLRIMEPVGSAMAFVIATVQPMPAPLRAQLREKLSRQTSVAGTAEALRTELAAMARVVPELRLKHLALPYVSQRRSDEQPAPAARALDWVAPTARWETGLTLATAKLSYAGGERLSLHVRSERPSQLLVLAMGNGGKIDVLYPNARQSGARPAGGELTLPPGDGDLRLRLRGARFGAAEEERILAITRPVGAAMPFEAPDPTVATLTLAPGSAAGRALETMLRTPEADRVVAELRYQVGPPPAH